MKFLLKYFTSKCLVINNFRSFDKIYFPEAREAKDFNDITNPFLILVVSNSLVS